MPSFCATLTGYGLMMFSVSSKDAAGLDAGARYIQVQMLSRGVVRLELVVPIGRQVRSTVMAHLAEILRPQREEGRP
jgi:hypothetical protein